MDKALTDYNEAIRFDPKYAGDNNRGIIYLQRETGTRDYDYEETIRLPRKEVALSRTCSILMQRLPPNVESRSALLNWPGRPSNCAPKDGYAWGIAYYRAGQWNDAITALKKSAEFTSGRDSRASCLDACHGLFLGMAYWQLTKRQGSHWYDKTAQSMEKPPKSPDDWQDGVLRAEADELMGKIATAGGRRARTIRCEEGRRR